MSISCSSALAFGMRNAQTSFRPSGDQASVPMSGYGVRTSRSLPVTTSTTARLPGTFGMRPAGAPPRTNAILSPAGDQAGCA